MLCNICKICFSTVKHNIFLEPGALKRKRQKIENPGQILRHLQEHDSKFYYYHIY